MGKTSFALGVLAHVGLQSQRPALLFSLEMGHLELTQRLLASEAEVNGQSLQTGRIRTQDWSKIGMAVTRLSSAPIFIDDNPNVTVMDIRARARRLKKSEGDLGIVVVDYLQLMTGRGRAENRQTEVAEISRGLKILARELEVPVVALSQLSRNLESRQDKTPAAVGPPRVGLARTGRRRRALHLPRVRVQRRGPDRPGRRRAGRSGQAALRDAAGRDAMTPPPGSATWTSTECGHRSNFPSMILAPCGSGLLQRQGPRSRPGLHPGVERLAVGCVSMCGESVPMGITFLSDPVAVAEIRRNAERGFTSMTFPERPT